jgi:N-acetylmuramoyl-L-alanine amidase
LPRATAVLLLALTFFVSGSAPPTAAQAPQSGLRILSREGPRALPTISLNNQEYVALDDIATTFGVTLREDRLAGGVTVTAATRTVIITPDQPVVSVAGRLVSLTTAPVRQGNRWLLPLDFLQRALGPALDTRMELRRAARMLVVGDLRVPRVTARVEASGTGTTVTFDSTPVTPARVTVEGGRVLVAFEADALEFTPPTVPPQDFLQAVQAGETPTTIRLMPGPKFGVHRATTMQADASSSRLVVEMLPTGTEPPVAAPPGAAAPAAPADLPPLAIPMPATGVRTIVTDAGHGGEELGARGPGGTLEKDVTLAVARRLRTMIEGRLGLRVFLTRDDDRTMSLDERSAYANSQKADVFISIHANAAVRPTMKGAEVYYLSLDRADAEARRMAESTGTALPALGGGTRTVDLILWEIAQARYLEQSSAFAGMVEQALRARVEMSPRAIQQAPFRVLVGANMPAVLVEIGYLSHPEQEQALASGAYQDQVTQSLFDALVQFRAQVERPQP